MRNSFVAVYKLRNEGEGSIPCFNTDFPYFELDFCLVAWRTILFSQDNRNNAKTSRMTAEDCHRMQKRGNF